MAFPVVQARAAGSQNSNSTSHAITLPAGTFYGGNALSASETFAGQGTYTLSDADVSLT